MGQTGATTDPTVTLTVNGKERAVPSGLSVTALLESFELQPGTVVVELNREIVRRPHYDQVTLTEGDQIELVHFVGGG